jgi:putative Mg2+ transporter-C (MgtC) family protein
MELSHLDFIKLLVSLGIGSVIGIEREYRGKSAGFRTIILITIGSTLFTIFSLKLGDLTSPERIASNIVVGIGFLGAGVIFKGDDRVTGLTTATTIWVAAALGMGIGGGYYAICAVATCFVLAVLYGFMVMERYIDAFSQTRKYKIVSFFNDESLYHYEELFKEFKLQAWKGPQTKKDNQIIGTWIVHGSANNHQKLINVLLNDKKIIEFDF